MPSIAERALRIVLAHRDVDALQPHLDLFVLLGLPASCGEGVAVGGAYNKAEERGCKDRYTLEVVGIIWQI